MADLKSLNIRRARVGLRKSQILSGHAARRLAEIPSRESTIELFYPSIRASLSEMENSNRPVDSRERLPVAEDAANGRKLVEKGRRARVVLHDPENSVGIFLKRVFFFLGVATIARLLTLLPFFLSSCYPWTIALAAARET